MIVKQVKPDSIVIYNITCRWRHTTVLSAFLAPSRPASSLLPFIPSLLFSLSPFLSSSSPLFSFPLSRSLLPLPPHMNSLIPVTLGGLSQIVPNGGKMSYFSKTKLLSSDCQGQNCAFPFRLSKLPSCYFFCIGRNIEVFDNILTVDRCRSRLAPKDIRCFHSGT